MHHDALKVHVGVCKQKGSVTGKGALTTRGRTKSVPFRRAVCRVSIRSRDIVSLPKRLVKL